MISEMIYIIAFTTEAIAVFYLSTSLYGTYIHKKNAIIATAITYLFLLSMFHIKNMFLNCILDITACTLLIMLISGIDFFSAFINAALLSIILNLSEMAASATGQRLLGENLSFNVETINLLFMAIFSRGLYIACVMIYVKLRKKHIAIRKSKSKWDLYCLGIPVISAFAVILLHNIEYKIYLTSLTTATICLLLVLLSIANILIIRMYDGISQKQNQIISLQQNIQQIAEHDSYNKLVDQQDINQKIIIHDIKNHLLTIRDQLTTGDVAGARAYVANLLDKDELSHNYTPTENRTLNLLLARYTQICKEKNIEFKIDVKDAKPELISDADITSLVCNLIDNAIGSAAKTEHAYIEFRLSYKSDEQLQLLTVENSCYEKPAYANNGYLKSTKPDSLKHGYGIRSITASATRYNGSFVYKFDEEEKRFYAIVVMRDRRNNE